MAPKPEVVVKWPPERIYKLLSRISSDPNLLELYFPNPNIKNIFNKNRKSKEFCIDFFGKDDPYIKHLIRIGYIVWDKKGNSWDIENWLKEKKCDPIYNKIKLLNQNVNYDFADQIKRTFNLKQPDTLEDIEVEKTRNQFELKFPYYFILIKLCSRVKQQNPPPLSGIQSQIPNTATDTTIKPNTNGTNTTTTKRKRRSSSTISISSSDLNCYNVPSKRVKTSSRKSPYKDDNTQDIVRRITAHLKEVSINHVDLPNKSSGRVLEKEYSSLADDSITPTPSRGLVICDTLDGNTNQIIRRIITPRKETDPYMISLEQAARLIEQDPTPSRSNVLDALTFVANKSLKELNEKQTISPVKISIDPIPITPLKVLINQQTDHGLAQRIEQEFIQEMDAHCQEMMLLDDATLENLEESEIQETQSLGPVAELSPQPFSSISAPTPASGQKAAKRSTIPPQPSSPLRLVSTFLAKPTSAPEDDNNPLISHDTHSLIQFPPPSKPTTDKRIALIESAEGPVSEIIIPTGQASSSTVPQNTKNCTTKYRKVVDETHKVKGIHQKEVKENYQKEIEENQQNVTSQRQITIRGLASSKKDKGIKEVLNKYKNKSVTQPEAASRANDIREWLARDPSDKDILYQKARVELGIAVIGRLLETLGKQKFTLMQQYRLYIPPIMIRNEMVKKLVNSLNLCGASCRYDLETIEEPNNEDIYRQLVWDIHIPKRKGKAPGKVCLEFTVEHCVKVFHSKCNTARMLKERLRNIGRGKLVYLAPGLSKEMELFTVKLLAKGGFDVCRKEADFMDDLGDQVENDNGKTWYIGIRVEIGEEYTEERLLNGTQIVTMDPERFRRYVEGLKKEATDNDV